MPGRESAPASLVRRIEDALRECGGDTSDPKIQLRAAEACLQQALAKGSARSAALDLLASDALLTSACGAAAVSRSMTVEHLADEAAGRWDELLRRETER